MNLARQAISATAPTQIIDVRFDADAHVFSCSTPSGFAVYRSWPLQLLKKREVVDGTISMITPLHSTSLLFLVGGGRSPRYPPNKVVFWDDNIGKEVAELEFRERVRGLACRRECLAVALRRRVVVFKFTNTIERVAEWDTSDNERGLLALATGPYSTLLAIPGHQIGHVRFVHLRPCPPPPPSLQPDAIPPRPPRFPEQQRKHPVSHIMAHTSALATIATTPSGKYVATTSVQGTLIRIWDAQTGNKLYEFRRGLDQANIYGVAFRPDERECCVWSDKGTVHVFSLDGSSNQRSALQPLAAFLPMSKYIQSEWSYAQYSLPRPPAHVALSTTSSASRMGSVNPDAGEEDRCVVAWVQVPGSQPSPVSPPQPSLSLPSVASSSPKGKGKARDLESNSDRERRRSTLLPQGPSSPPPKKETLAASNATVPAPQYQLIALTYSGGWYRLSLPGSTSPGSTGDPKNFPKSSKSAGTPTRASTPTGYRGSLREEGKQRRTSGEVKSNVSSSLLLEEFRRFGRFDGWG